MSDGPTGGEITAAISDLRADAQKWNGLAEQVSAVVGAADGLVIDAQAFSFAGEQVGLPEVYASAQTKVADRLREGALNIAEVGAALTQVANQYEADEAAGVHRMTGIY